MPATSLPAPLLECESTLTAKYQTTVPQQVRERLHLAKSDKLRFVLRADGSVVLENASAPASDPVLDNFLSFLERDMQNNPGNIAPMRRDLMARAQELVVGVGVDLDESLPDDDE